MAITPIGIDLGTTNTVVAHNEKVLPIETPDGQTLKLASCVSFLPNGTVVVGEAAKHRKLMDPDNTIVAAKRIMSAKWRDACVGDYRNRYPTKLDRTESMHVAFKTRAGLFRPREIAVHLIRESILGAGLDPGNCAAVITVPAAYSAQQREDTTQAGIEAGLDDVELLDEPVATALAHGQIDGVQHAAVYDVGGGTFDVCILDCSLWPVGMLGHGGDLFLGGDDFDEAIAANIAARLLEQLRWDVRTDEEIFGRLVEHAERIKRELAAGPISLRLRDIDPSLPPSAGSLPLDQTLISESCYGIVRRTFRTCSEVLESLDLTPLSMDRLLLAGGGSEMPLVRDWVVTYFGIEPAPEVSPFEAIARGASLAARERFG